MEKTALFSAEGEDTPLPDDYLAMRAIYIEGSPDKPLRAMSPTALRQEFDGSTGTPVAYSLVANGIRLAPPPSSEILLSMDYFGSLDALSSIAPSNWLLEQHPSAYLYATLFHAEAFLDNATRAAQWKGLLDEIVGRIMKTARETGSARARWFRTRFARFARHDAEAIHSARVAARSSQQCPHKSDQRPRDRQRLCSGQGSTGGHCRASLRAQGWRGVHRHRRNCGVAGAPLPTQ
jgi:hypothetical protein